MGRWDPLSLARQVVARVVRAQTRTTAESRNMLPYPTEPRIWIFTALRRKPLAHREPGTWLSIRGAGLSMSGLLVASEHDRRPVSVHPKCPSAASLSIAQSLLPSGIH